MGILFIATPDGVIDTLDDAGDAIGSFATGPETDQKLWLALGFAYMTVITGLALVIATNPRRYRPFLLVLAAGKAASSLAAGAFYVFDQEVFAYLVNFAVDLSLVGVAIGCWVLLGPEPEAESEPEAEPEAAAESEAATEVEARAPV
ncbi:MAG TPA: hypothetical protein VJT75_02595 [Thermoleophilaceae bacterium]|nr:hypothetical protein [Thermoleophilaceae bacterium]